MVFSYISFMSMIAQIIGCCFFTFSWATIVTQINYVKFLIDSYNRLLRSFLLNNEIALPKAFFFKNMLQRTI